MKKFLISGLMMFALIFASAPQFVHAQDPRAGASNGSANSTASINTTSCSTLGDNGLGGVVGCIVSFFNIAIYLMVAASVVLTMYGAFNMIASEDKRESGRQTVVYGIIGLFVMISIWGFVNILVNTFNLSGYDSSIIPKTFIK